VNLFIQSLDFLIYSTSDSYNDGKILSENQSCSLESNLNNQATCGNCNYLLGSTCGANTENEKASFGDFVCKDIRCKDGEGKIRDNGESWCEYQGAIGTDIGTSGLLRAIDTPGSRHFRMKCIDGEVKTEPCADYRNEICVDSEAESIFPCHVNTLSTWGRMLTHAASWAETKASAKLRASPTGAVTYTTLNSAAEPW
jgi:hypothetical protein